jgi:Mg2+/citrate symporter
VISTVLLVSVVVLLAIAFYAARQSRQRQTTLERDNDAMKRELERHRQTAQSILRELQNP